MNDGALAATQQTVAAQFERVAANYRTSAVHARGADLQQLAVLIAARRPARLLDLGCGAGHAALAVAAHAGQVDAVDLSAAMLAQTLDLARERAAGNVAVHQADVSALPFADETFDAAVSRYSAHHWPDLPAVLRELARVLRPGAPAYIADVVGHAQARHDTFLQTIEYLRDPSHVRDYTPAEWQQAAQAAGLQCRVLDQQQLRLEFDAWTARMQTPPAETAVLRGLLGGADVELRRVFAVDGDGFSIPIALFELTR